MVGTSGTGDAAIDDGLAVAWFTLEILGQLVTRHRADDTVAKAVGRVLKAALVVIDGHRAVPVPAEALIRGDRLTNGRS